MFYVNLLCVLIGDEIVTEGGAIKCLVEHPHQFKKLVLFSGNDYLGLSSHPTIGRAAAKVCLRILTLQKKFCLYCTCIINSFCKVPETPF